MDNHTTDVGFGGWDNGFDPAEEHNKEWYKEIEEMLRESVDGEEPTPEVLVKRLNYALKLMRNPDATNEEVDEGLDVLLEVIKYDRYCYEALTWISLVMIQRAEKSIDSVEIVNGLPRRTVNANMAVEYSERTNDSSAKRMLPEERDESRDLLCLALAYSAKGRDCIKSGNGEEAFMYLKKAFPIIEDAPKREEIKNNLIALANNYKKYEWCVEIVELLRERLKADPGDEKTRETLNEIFPYAKDGDFFCRFPRI